MMTSLVAQRVKASAYDMGDPGSIPGSGRSPGEGNGNPLLPGKSHGRRSLGSVTLQDVAVEFNPEEWQLLDYDQRTLYWDVILENFRNFISVGMGCPVTETTVIFKVEQGQEPWMVEAENSRWSSPGHKLSHPFCHSVSFFLPSSFILKVQEQEADCPLVDESDKHQKIKDNFNSVLFMFNKILTVERLHGYNMSTSLNPTRKKSYKCKSYGKSLQPTLDFLNYNRCYNGEHSDECNECGKAFKKKFNFIRHEKNHTRKKLNATTVGKPIAARHTLPLIRKFITERDPLCAVIVEKRLHIKHNSWSISDSTLERSLMNAMLLIYVDNPITSKIIHHYSSSFR
ncbi:zinc finger protein 684 [Moschus berezovskii]|uniref:zinc finger protein 684 n=1 Tax=Moschus berezovskii TaxID=68408 RepID=UPI002444BAC2|nr:zinc finger protein 684 [Moschus berezovskii]